MPESVWPGVCEATAKDDSTEIVCCILLKYLGYVGHDIGG